MPDDSYKKFSKVRNFRELKNLINSYKQNMKLKFFECLYYYANSNLSFTNNFKGTIYEVLFKTPYNLGVYIFCKNFLTEIKFFEVVTYHSVNNHLFLGVYLLENLNWIFPYFKLDEIIDNYAHNFINNELSQNYKNENNKKLFLKIFGNFKHEYTNPVLNTSDQINQINNLNYSQAEQNANFNEVIYEIDNDFERIFDKIKNFDFKNLVLELSKDYSKTSDFFNMMLKKLFLNQLNFPPRHFHNTIFRALHESEDKDFSLYIFIVNLIFECENSKLPRFNSLDQYLENQFILDFPEFEMSTKIREEITLDSLRLISMKETLFVTFRVASHFNDNHKKQKKENFTAKKKFFNFMFNRYLTYECDIFFLLDFVDENDFEILSFLITKLLSNYLYEEAYYVLKINNYNEKISFDGSLEEKLKNYLNGKYLNGFYDENNDHAGFSFLEYQEKQKKFDSEDFKEQEDNFEYTFDRHKKRDKYFYSKLENMQELHFENLDEFKPRRNNSMYLTEDVKVVYVDTLDKLENLKKEKFSEILGVDMEWKPDRGDEKNLASLMQIADTYKVYLFDLNELRKYTNFLQIFTKIFKDNKFLAFSFHNDTSKIEMELGEFFNQPEKVIDITSIYEEYFNKKCPSLNDLSVKFYKKTICKYFQCSNWNKRPLNKGQLHYAALDSHILLDFYKNILAKEKQKPRDSSKKQNVNVQENLNFSQVGDVQENLTFSQVLSDYAENQYELMLLEKSEEEDQNKKKYSTMTIDELKEEEVYLDNLKLERVEKREFLKRFFLTFKKPNYPTQISKGDKIGVYKLNANMRHLTEQVDEADVFFINDKTITLISETDMRELGKYTKYCFVRLVEFGAFKKIEECLIKMMNCEIPDCSLNLLKVLLKFDTPSTHTSLPSSSEQNFNCFVNSSQKSSEQKFYNCNLNSSQKAAIEDCFSRKELSLIHGPPGTGKTTTIVELILKCVEKGQKILVCSHSNIAVDNIAEKLIDCKKINCLDFEICRIGRPARLLESVLEICIDALVNKGPYETYVDHIIFLKSTLKKRDDNGIKAVMARIRELQKLIDGYIKNEIFENCNVVLSTNVGAGNKNLQEYLEENKSYFDLVIIDEAGQAPEYSCWIPILAGEKLIMAGDHKQLPPTVLSGIARQEIFKTLFEKMNDHYKEQVSSMLQIQYRMNKLIMGFSSKEFYFNKLIAHSSVENRSLRDIIQPSQFDNFNLTSKNLIQVDTANYKFLENQDRKSFYNTGESNVVVFFIEYLIKIGVKKSDIGVITPYRGQVKLIKSKMPSDMKDLDISSVDGFQGREKEVIIISLVRSNDQSNIGFVHDERRMNVALTRAKRLNILIWNSCNFQSNSFFKRLNEYFDENGTLFSVQNTNAPQH